MATVCQCPNPPGGQATCGDNQIAICRVVGGVAHTECISVSTDLVLTSLAGQNWLLSHVYQTPRRPLEPVDANDRAVITSGRYRVPGTRDEVVFRLPVGSRLGRPAGA